MAKAAKKAEEQKTESKGYEVLVPFTHKGKHYLKGDIANDLSEDAVKLFKNVDFIK